MGRSLQNTMTNIGISGACDEAMYQVRTHQALSVFCYVRCLGEM
jgi:hypothetical protein